VSPLALFPPVCRPLARRGGVSPERLRVWNDERGRFSGHTGCGWLAGCLPKVLPLLHSLLVQAARDAIAHGTRFRSARESRILAHAIRRVAEATIVMSQGVAELVPRVRWQPPIVSAQQGLHCAAPLVVGESTRLTMCARVETCAVGWEARHSLRHP
jgi:hypothetical protein